ncbi:protein ZNF783-like [Dermochelys coriacea]|uniref:protein ZNF783-like n=1 Tax=Dermochelys coriacea TaxID=27794 RepID=UPI001CA9F92F|nr:protein ZNF783-like [Dermochelys coriacea]
MAAGGSAQVPVAFEGVAVYFSPEEWAALVEWQRELYQAVMKENYELVASLGHLGAKPEIIFQMERGEEPYVGDPWSWKERSTAQNPCSGSPMLDSWKQLDCLGVKKEILACHDTGSPCRLSSILLLLFLVQHLILRVHSGGL